MQTLPVLLLVALGTVGAVDLAYYHIWKFRLYGQPSSRGEHVTHLVRGALFVVELGLLLRFRASGAWFWILGGLFVADFLNSLADVALEPASRRPLGGVPPIEYLVHIATSSISGALAATFLIVYWPARLASTALTPWQPGAIPTWLWLDGWLVLAGGVGLWTFESVMFVRSLAGAER